MVEGKTNNISFQPLSCFFLRLSMKYLFLNESLISDKRDPRTCMDDLTRESGLSSTESKIIPCRNEHNLDCGKSITKSSATFSLCQI